MATFYFDLIYPNKCRNFHPDHPLLHHYCWFRCPMQSVYSFVTEKLMTIQRSAIHLTVAATAEAAAAVEKEIKLIFFVWPGCACIFLRSDEIAIEKLNRLNSVQGSSAKKIFSFFSSSGLKRRHASFELNIRCKCMNKWRELPQHTYFRARENRYKFFFCHILCGHI